MKYHSSLRHGLMLLSLGLATLSAQAGDDCDAPLNRWQTREAVLQMAAAKGWQIQRLKIDDGCYEIRGTDAQGQTFKAKLDPQTLKVLKMKPYNHPPTRDRDRDRDPEGAAHRAQPPQPNGAEAPPPSSTGGSAPHGQAD